MGSHLQPVSDTQPDDEGRSTVPDRILPAWQVWLEALATDAEAALGAALAYESMNEEGRDAFLTALEQDAGRLGVPRIALFAPFLSVENDEDRRMRIQAALGDDFGTSQRRRPRALMGIDRGGDRVAAVISPMYLDFVRVITCRFSPSRGFSWVRTNPLVHAKDAPGHGASLDGVGLDAAPLEVVVDEIATAVVAQRDPSGHLPPSLDPLLQLFDARLRDSE